MYLSLDDYRTVVTLTPIISIDMLARNQAGEYLLGYRTNAPARNTWFVPGGSIRKSETLDDAFLRISENELGMSLSRNDASFLGVFEHHYADSCCGDSIGTHYVVLAHQLELDIGLDSLPRAQHGKYRWFTREQLLNSPEVHLHTKWYLQTPG